MTTEPYLSNKTYHSDRRGGTFQSYNSRERPEGRGRGGMRGGRNGNGNGNGNGYQNNHHGREPPFTNGQTPYPSATYAGQRSPPMYQDAQSFFGAPQHGGRGYRGQNPRTQSIPVDTGYTRGPNGFAGSNMAPLQTSFSNSSYEYVPMQTMSAFPNSGPYLDHYSLYSSVSVQLEYYFSVENLCKDIFLRKHMDSQGFVFLSLVAGFSRLKKITLDLELVKLVCLHSTDIEYKIGSDGKDRIRRHDGWEKFVLSNEERDPEAQHDGPRELFAPPPPKPTTFDLHSGPSYTSRHSMSAMPSSPTGGHFGGFQSLNGFAQYPPTAAYPYGEPATPSQYQHYPSHARSNGSMSSGAAATAAPLTAASPAQQENEPDSFTDEQVQTLQVIVKKGETSQQRSAPPPASRTFSNGSLDPRNIAEELAEPAPNRNPEQDENRPASQGLASVGSIAPGASADSDSLEMVGERLESKTAL